MNEKAGKTEDNRTINLQFRVNEEEMKCIEERQAQVKILNRSAYLRKMALNGSCIRVDIKELHKAGYLLSSISNNMNQYAKKANATGSIYLEDINSLKEKYSELIQVYGEVLSQLIKFDESIN